MIKRIQIVLTIIGCMVVGTTTAQVNVSQQLNTIPGNLSKYVDGYLHDLTNDQGVSYLNTVHTSGKVLDKWELSFSLNTGTALLSAYDIRNDFGPNFDMRGRAPSIFGSGTDGELAFRFIDENTGGAIVDPFTGEEIGFSIPFLPGADVGLGLSPAIMPVVSLGVGFGTEVSVSVLPGAIKAASKSVLEDFEINKDMMYSLGIRHDVFNWIPVFADRNFHLTVGAIYNKMTVGANVGQGLFDDFENISSDLMTATNNLTGVEYGFSSMGFEAMLSKKLSFIDLSLFASTNKSDYTVQSEGNIVVKTANNFYSNDPQGYTTTTLENLVDVEGNTSRFIYGLALQFNFGRLSLGTKFGVADEASYVAASLGFKILKN